MSKRWITTRKLKKKEKKKKRDQRVNKRSICNQNQFLLQEVFPEPSGLKCLSRHVY